MAKTPYQDLGSQDILAAHISGLQHSLNKVEEILDMDVASANGIPLTPVSDQEDPEMRFRVYEGSIRNWTQSTVYRDGLEVARTEYEIQEAYGVIVFHEQQNPTSVLTADVQYISSHSEVISTVENRIDTAEGDIGGLDSRVTTLENNGGDGGGGTGSVVPSIFQAPGSWRTCTLKWPTRVKNDVLEEDFSAAVGVGTNHLDFFPFPVHATTRFDVMRFKTANQTYTSGSAIAMGIYSTDSSKPLLQPGKLVAQTSETKGMAASTSYAPNFSGGTITLQPGLYWLARHGNYFFALDDAIPEQYMYQLGRYTSSNNLVNWSGGMICGGIRWVKTYSPTMPGTVPDMATTSEDLRYLVRAYYCCPWIRAVEG